MEGGGVDSHPYWFPPVWNHGIWHRDVLPQLEVRPGRIQSPLGRTNHRSCSVFLARVSVGFGGVGWNHALSDIRALATASVTRRRARSVDRRGIVIEKTFTVAVAASLAASSEAAEALRFVPIDPAIPCEGRMQMKEMQWASRPSRVSSVVSRHHE